MGPTLVSTPVTPFLHILKFRPMGWVGGVSQRKPNAMITHEKWKTNPPDEVARIAPRLVLLVLNLLFPISIIGWRNAHPKEIPKIQLLGGVFLDGTRFV